LNNETQLRQQLAEAEAKVIQWENRFANLSHSMKNSIASIQGALRYVINDDKLDDSNRITIRRALRNLNLMRDLAFSINHSYNGTVEDFIYDIQNPDATAFDFQQLVLHSLYSGFNNIFDGTNFGKFQAGYFPRNDDRAMQRKLLIQAKQALQKLDGHSLDDFVNYAKQYLLDLEINLIGVDDYRIGNSKSSGMRMMVLFQELIFNAIKYSSFVERAQRQLSINVTALDNYIEL
jgi:signal transduction histidine kinase